jgi:hypothetical protein
MTFHSPTDNFPGICQLFTGNTSLTTVNQPQAILFHVIPQNCVKSLPIQHTFSAHKTFIRVVQNVKLFYHPRRHPVAFSIQCRPPFVVLTFGSDRLSKSHCKKIELRSIIELVLNISVLRLFPAPNPHRRTGSITHADIFHYQELITEKLYLTIF